MKEQENFPEELNEREIINLSDIELRIMIVRMLHEKRYRNNKKMTSWK